MRRKSTHPKRATGAMYQEDVRHAHTERDPRKANLAFGTEGIFLPWRKERALKLNPQPLENCLLLLFWEALIVQHHESSSQKPVRQI